MFIVFWDERAGFRSSSSFTEVLIGRGSISLLGKNCHCVSSRLFIPFLLFFSLSFLFHRISASEGPCIAAARMLEKAAVGCWP